MYIKHLLLIPALILPAHAVSITMGDEKTPQGALEARLPRPPIRRWLLLWGEKTSARVIKRGNALMLMGGKYCLLEENIFLYTK